MDLIDLLRDDDYLREVYGIENDSQFVAIMIEPEYCPYHLPVMAYLSTVKVDKRLHLPLHKEIKKI
jgi:hypothetical protein